MDTNRILTDLRAERDRIDQAINAIEALNGRAVRNAATFQGGSTPRVNQPTNGRAGARPGISAAGRKRISEAVKKMWAQRRKQAASRPRPAMSAATKKKLSQAAKARWSDRKRTN
jgi:hypothetical protein